MSHLLQTQLRQFEHRVQGTGVTWVDGRVCRGEQERCVRVYDSRVRG